MSKQQSPAPLAQQPGRQKHVPLRTCVVCRATSAKRALTRLVRTVDEGVQIDPTGKRNGRGAYLCDQASCWQKAVSSDVLEKALRTTLSAEDRERISHRMALIVDVRK
jgi:predicted RNA-binding protein YlxR (DUF448 family)